MSQWSLKNPPSSYPNAVATSSGWCDPDNNMEILVAIGGLVPKNTDASVLPTFTLAVPANGTYPVGSVLTFTLTASDAITVVGTPSIDVTIGANVRQAQYDSASSTATVLNFKYTTITGDAAPSGVVVAPSIDLNTTGKGKSKIVDTIANSGGENVPASALTFTVPSTVGIVTTG
jgi:hypothetical protein